MFAIMRFHYIEVLNFEPYILLITEVKNIILKYNDYNIFICLMLNFILDCTRAYTKNMSGTYKLHVHSVFYMFYFIM